MTDTAELPPETGRRRRLVLFLAVVFALVLVPAGLVGTWLLGVWGDAGPKAQPGAGPSLTGPPSPFAGTPAERFAEGADGIDLPPAEPVGDFTAEQVQEALEHVRDALIAARLDESMLVEHDPSAFLAALAPDHRRAQQLAFDSAAFAEYATHIAEDAKLASATPRVAGSVSYGLTTAERDIEVIEITTSFVWVYPFEADNSQSGSDLVVVRDELVWLYRQGLPWTEDSEGLWLAAESARIWGADCEVAADAELLPDDEPAANLVEQAEAIFDPERPLEGPGGC